jgi:predicted transglutaminase-like cysteine proteinase
MKLIILALVALTSAACPSHALDRRPAVGAALAVGAAVRPISAWVEFCSKPGYARECRVDLREPRAIVLTPGVWSRIERINRSVNAGIAPLDDLRHRGREDVWDLAEDGRGDCEDLQLRKRHILAAAGLPRRAMRMAAVALPDGSGHAVLTITTDRGDIVLDNQRDAVLPWVATGYTCLKRESQDGVGWVELDGSAPSTAPAPAWVSAIAR